MIYYSTQSNPVRDITDSTVWSSTMPSDLSTVKAIAVDCRKNADGTDFLMTPLSTMNLYINMQSPQDRSLIDKVTMNESVIIATTQSGQKESFANCQFTLVDTDFYLHKYQGTGYSAASLTNQNDYPNEEHEDAWRQTTGSNYTFAYRVVLQNQDNELNYNRVVLEDDIPEGMVFNLAGSAVYIYKLKDASVGCDTVANRYDPADEEKKTKAAVYKKLSETNDYFDVEVKKNGDGTDHVRVTIYKMEPGVYYDFRFAVKNTFSFTGDEYANTATITSVNGVDCGKSTNTVKLDGVNTYYVYYKYVTKDADGN